MLAMLAVTAPKDCNSCAEPILQLAWRGQLKSTAGGQLCIGSNLHRPFKVKRLQNRSSEAFCDLLSARPGPLVSSAIFAVDLVGRA